MNYECKARAINFPLTFLPDTYFPLEMIPSYLQTISKALPLIFFSESLKHAMIYKNPEGVYLKIAIVAVFSIIFIIIDSLVTKWKEK